MLVETTRVIKSRRFYFYYAIVILTSWPWTSDTCSLPNVTRSTLPRNPSIQKLPLGH